ncbi:MAG: phosphatidylcholine and lysophosphatidylcholine phospholipase [Trizodia sp. TS-e1964]|nr:MAG: phosphatidylcholine and lysophosphatidylcholine phospholipase [Trizodia sp. TS-e1964]
MSTTLSSAISMAAATSLAMDPAPRQMPSPDTLLGLIWRLLLFLLTGLPSTLYWLFTFSTLTLPALLFTLFSTSLTFTMNFTTILLIALALVSTVSWFVRYRFLNMYARLPPEPQRVEPQIDLFPDTQEGDTKPGLANYLDEFLSAIKIFGFLERPVFHELTRTMQTRKLIAGETLLLEEENGFCIVVDGLVQIFVKSSRESHDSNSDSQQNGIEDNYEDEEEHYEYGNQGYQLLTEVKNGAPMSSLFSILSLFTEDVSLRHVDDEEEPGEINSATSRFHHARFPSDLGLESTDVSAFSGPSSPLIVADGPRKQYNRRERRSSHIASPMAGGNISSIPPLFLDMSSSNTPHLSQQHTRISQNTRAKNKPKSVHPDIVARATVDTTIAIIPATAFHRLTRVYPKATAHIVQVILTRLQRVTLATAHSYLGLTSEVLRTEKHMDKYTTYELPNFLRGGALQRLKDKFQKEKERIGPEDGSKGIALHNSNAGRRRRSSSTLRREAATQSRIAALRSTPDNSPTFATGAPARYSAFGPDLNGISAGDLLSDSQSKPGARRSHIAQSNQSFQPPPVLRQGTLLSQRSFDPFAMISPMGSAIHRQESMDEDCIFRESVLECIFKAIGLTNTKNAHRKTSSVEASPRLVSYDSRRQKAVFNNAFGFIDPYEGSNDGESESIVSSAISMGGSLSGDALKIKDDVEIVFFPKGSVLVERGQTIPGLYYSIDGFLEASIPADGANSESNTLGADASSAEAHQSKRKSQSEQKTLFLIKPGGIAGYIGTISSYRSFVDVRAKTDVYVGFLPRASLEKIVEKYPVVLLTMAKRMTSLLPRLILHIDFALEWVQVNAGHVLYHQSDESDAIYIVLNGRLRAVIDEGTKAVGEYGQGESVGELEVMTESTRPATLHAIRDTEVARFPRTLFNSLALEHPGITIKISKIIASRMRALIEDPLFEQRKDKTASNMRITSTVNLRTVTILPVRAGVPVVEFGSRLVNALTQLGTANGVATLNQAAILNHLGRHAFSRMGKLKLSQYLADLEMIYGMVIYVADTNVNSPWTQTCISQADCILLIGLAEGSPSIGEYERFLLGMKTTARKELVLLHTDRFSPPGLTREWLKNRVWVNGGHHHIQMSFRTSPEPVLRETKRFGLALKQRVQVIQAEIQKYTSRRVQQTPLYSSETPFKGDFHRLARRLCGKSVGLVLGGGGARGIAQVGVIRAIEEAGIPIDIVGGTSIGSFIGALYARDADVVPMYGRAKKFAGRMGSMWRFALDLTYPSASYTTGHEFNRGIYKTFGNSQIEDSWLEFYCNTTNISHSRQEFHTSGYVWRYVRASMSLAGLLPPLCDEGSMLLDGGYIDNLTVAHMKSLGADVIFAVDVGSRDVNQAQAFGDALSGFWAVLNRWNPFSSHPNPPTLAEIQARLAYVSSVDALERAKNTPGCLYMRPPIDAYATLDFAKFDEIYNVGYQYGQEYLAKMREKGVLPVMEETEEKKNLRRTMAPRRASI